MYMEQEYRPYEFHSDLNNFNSQPLVIYLLSGLTFRNSILCFQNVSMCFICIQFARLTKEQCFFNDSQAPPACPSGNSNIQMMKNGKDWRNGRERENRNTIRQTCPTATSSITNFTGTDLGPNSDFSSNRPVTNLDHGRVDIYTIEPLKTKRRQLFKDPVRTAL